MRVAKIRGRVIRLCWSGRRQRELAARAYSMCCKSTRSILPSGLPSFGRSLRRPAKGKLRCRNCFRIRLAFARWINEWMCSITTRSFGRSKRKSRCGRRELLMVIMPALSVFFWTSSCVESPGRLYRIIGNKILPSRSTSIFGSVYPKRRTHVWRQFTRRRAITHRSRNNSILISQRRALWRAGRSLLLTDCMQSAR